jgi:hypothetical protein
MFPGFTELQMRTHNQDVLREAGFMGGLWTAGQRAPRPTMRVSHFLAVLLRAALAVICW